MLLNTLKKFERKEKCMTILEIFSSGTVALYTFTRKDPNDRKYIRDFTSLVDVEKWLKGEVIRDYAEQVEG
jgi:hypothetical protein